METACASPTNSHINPATLLTIVRGFTHGSAGRPADDPHSPTPRGPWDPIIRSLIKQWFLRQHPEAIDLFIPHGPIFRDRLSLVGLNPQPLPPRHSFIVALAESVITRAELLQELAGGAADDAEKRGIIIVSGYVGRFVRDFTQPRFRLPLRAFWRELRPSPDAPYPPPVWPWPPHFPPPPPEPPEWNEELSGFDLVVLGATFAETAQRTFDREMRATFNQAATQFAEAGAQRLG